MEARSVSDMARAAKDERQIKMWAVEQAVRLVPAPDQVIELARRIEDYVQGRLMPRQPWGGG
jgi:hypothetical protein